MTENARSERDVWKGMAAGVAGGMVASLDLVYGLTTEIVRRTVRSVL